MKRYVFTAFIFFQTSIVCTGQDYRKSFVPDSLIENANAVIILDEGELELINKKRSILKRHQVIMILNHKAKDLAVKYLGYDKLRSVQTLKGIAYEANIGLALQTSSNFDIEDYSATSGGTLFDDNRVKYLDLKQDRFPYIVEFWTTQVFKTTYFAPDWYVLPDEYISVMKSSFEIKAPKELMPNFLVVNSDQQMEITEEKEQTSAKISFENLKAIKREPYGPPMRDLSPVVYCSPGEFSFDGYDGNSSTWKEIGDWQNILNVGRDVLPEGTISEINQLTVNSKTDEEKARLVYQYVQNKTRYVSIQLGIGGYQPFSATSVDEVGYGDCKALTNYTQSLLKEVGVRSHYTWVYGGDNPPGIKRDFPIDKFNHIILCVPNQGDTLWLECTSQTNPFGYLGNFTGDRDVMVVTESGGKIVRTPRYTKNDNLQITSALVDVDRNGNANAKMNIQYTGLQYENGGLDFVINDGKEKLKEWVYKHTDISNFEIKDFNFSLEKSRIPKIDESLDIEITSLVSRSGDRVFLVPNLNNRWKRIPKKVEDRKTDIVLSFEYQDKDSIVYNLPVEYSLEYLPKNVNYESQFGTFEVNYKLENNQLIYVRKVSRNKGRFDKSAYQEFREFYRKVVRSDKAKVVFIDKT